MIFRTTLRDKCSSRQLSLIGLPREKYARRILAIVSTTSIPIAASQNPGGQCGPNATGSRLDENHPVAGSLFHERTQLARNAALRTYVEERLAGVVVAPSGAPVPGPVVSWKSRRHGPRKDRRWANAWSPEQIARRLPVDFADDATMRISHEAIYQALFVQGRGALRRELTACLRTGRALRVPRARARGRGKKFVTPEVMI